MAETLRPQLPAGARIAVGMVVVLLGLGLIAIGLTPSMSATPGMGIVGVPAGLVFACGGVLVLLPERLAQLRLPIAALMITALAGMFGWVAFGPGERRFTGSFGAGGAALSWTGGEIAGRAFFGLFALLSAVAALGLWIRVIRGAKRQ